MVSSASRRTFLKSTMASVLASSCSGVTTLLGTEKKSASGKPIIGSGEYRYEVDHHWYRWDVYQNCGP